MLRICPLFSVSVLRDSVTTVYCMDLHVTVYIFIILLKKTMAIVIDCEMSAYRKSINNYWHAENLAISSQSDDNKILANI